LDKRRAKWLTTREVVTETEGVLAQLDKKLEANVRQREASKAALEAAVKRAAELEKELKALVKQREQLRAHRTHAKRDVKKSRRRAQVSEQRFDRALLKDLLRKAKSADLATNGEKAVRAVTPRSAGSDSKANGTTPRRAAAATRRRSAPVAASTRRPAATNGRSARS
jgi:chromosome segregation ATPase